MSEPPVSPQRLSIAVVGLGGIGGTAAGLLTRTGLHDVTACVRKPLERLMVEGPDGAFEVPLTALTDPADARPVDWVLLCTKTHETASAGPWLERLCTPSTTVAALQNGIDHVERIAPYVNGAAIVPALVYYNGERLAPDHVRYKPVSENELVVPDDAGGRAFAALMGDTPLHVLVSADFVTLKWRKLLVNAIANPITALTLQRFAVFERPDIQLLSLAILDEAGRVARVDGAGLHDDESQRVLKMVRGFGANLSTSTYFDRLAGRPFEVEALTGAIVAAGERYGIATPLNGLLLTLLRAISEENAKTQT
ncbi:2-dehydropantoate 2-reductase [Pseudolabrys sp. FHR47]|uniref:2-dehydropantoate 2-reductase n=1 Tax=Pseudolabrys sp. FHR47 TaxID=2562284 RepID=UPI0010BE8757|nr:2-dehydropantoate 2-reductase [Pseudolabrys sp. FHR47]